MKAGFTEIEKLENNIEHFCYLLVESYIVKRIEDRDSNSKFFIFIMSDFVESELHINIMRRAVLMHMQQQEKILEYSEEMLKKSKELQKYSKTMVSNYDNCTDSSIVKKISKTKFLIKELKFTLENDLKN